MMAAEEAAADIARYCAGGLFFCSVRAGEEAAQDRRRAKQAAQAAQAEIRHQRPAITMMRMAIRGLTVPMRPVAAPSEQVSEKVAEAAQLGQRASAALGAPQEE